MKKTLLIGTIVVLVLALAGGVIAFAAWDKPEDNIDLAVNNVASNVNVDASVFTSSADTTNKLIPSVASIKGANDIEIIKAGKFNVKLSSDDKNAALSDLIAKVDVTYNVYRVTYGDDITTATTEFTGKKWSDYVEVTVCKSDNAKDKVTGNALTITDNTDGTDFFVYIAFKDFANVDDETEQKFIKSLSGKVFKIYMTINIASKKTNA